MELYLLHLFSHAVADPNCRFCQPPEQGVSYVRTIEVDGLGDWDDSPWSAFETITLRGR